MSPNCSDRLLPSFSGGEDEFTSPAIIRGWSPLMISLPQPSGESPAVGPSPGHLGPAPHRLSILAPPLRSARASAKPRFSDHPGRSRSGHAQWPGRWGRRTTPGPARSRGAGASGKWAGAAGSGVGSPAAERRWPGGNSRESVRAGPG